MNRKKSIVCLSRYQLEPHPDNPRKDLGDLTELRESIRQNGIMQNLTVIPTDDTLEHFRILIGHRRFAASEGILNELPCVIVEDLTDREQVGIMLCENLQRNDLTFYEQGQGFQMMLDLGDTIDEISEKTGFSKNTVKHRVEIAKLPKKAIEDNRFQLTIGDLIELEKIADVKKREKILSEAFDSNNLKNRINQEIREQKIQKNLKLVKEWLKKCKVKKAAFYGIQYSSDYEKLLTIDLEDLKGMTLEKIKAKVEGKTDVEWNDSYGAIYVCRKLAKNEKPKKKKSDWEIKEEKRKEKTAKINAAEEAYCKSVFRFLNESEERHFRAGTGVYTERAWMILLKLEARLERWVSHTFFENSDAGDDFYKELTTKPLLWQMLFYVIQNIEIEGLCNYHLEPDKNTFAAIEDLNSILHSLGYNVPPEIDESILDGTSDLYNHPEEDSDDEFEDDEFEDDEEC